jgi:hypothetical protein
MKIHCNIDQILTIKRISNEVSKHGEADHGAKLGHDVCSLHHLVVVFFGGRVPALVVLDVAMVGVVSPVADAPAI